MTRRNAFVTLVALLALALAAPATAAVKTGPSGNAFYTPPKKLPGKTHGDAIWVRKLTGEQTLTEASANQLVLYRSTSPRRTGRRARAPARRPPAAPAPRPPAAGAGRASSASVFHWPQPGQRPCHLGLSCPHSVQAYTVAERAITRG